MEGGTDMSSMNGQCAECGETGALRFQIDSNCLGYSELHQRVVYETTIWVCSKTCLRNSTDMCYDITEDGGEDGRKKSES